jgi:putative flippase GtrA
MADWDSKLAKIDKQLESLSDDQLIGKTGRAATPAQAQDIERVKKETSTFGVFARLVLAVLMAIGIIFWPYASRCGIGLAAYLGAVTVVIASGVWSAIWTFRHRTGRAHTLSLLLILWGLVLAATEVLPRLGYAVPTAQHPASWSCS